MKNIQFFFITIQIIMLPYDLSNMQFKECPLIWMTPFIMFLPKYKHKTCMHFFHNCFLIGNNLLQNGLSKRSIKMPKITQLLRTSNAFSWDQLFISFYEVHELPNKW
jgi:hypothetical protein